MKKQQTPTMNQANTLFFITITATLFGSAILQPILGLGANLWINEYVYILLPPLLLAKLNKWPVENIYRLKTTTRINNALSLLSGFCLWFFAAYTSKALSIFLDHKVGILPGLNNSTLSIYQSMLLFIGMVILAPICEEIYFRGLVQKAYEGYNKRSGFIITGLIFGVYHILNGISEVIPACILGIAMGYLVYKTDSLSTSILFHAAANSAAIVMGGFFKISTLTSIPVWFHILAFAGLFTSVFLLSRVKSSAQVSESNSEAQKVSRATAAGFIFLILSVSILLIVGTYEILARSGILSLQ